MRAMAAVSMVIAAIGALVACGSSSPRVASSSFAEREPATEGGPSDGDDEPSSVLDSADDTRADERRTDERRTDDRRSDESAGPRVATVVQAAYAAAGLGGRVPGRFAVRARLGGLVPWVSVRTGRDASWHDEDPDVGRGTTLEVRATWRLDRLVFDGRELQVVALDAALRRERRRLATHVIRTYFTWKRSVSRSGAEEAAAELDALTSGWFSESIQRGASEVRTVRIPASTP